MIPKDGSALCEGWGGPPGHSCCREEAVLVYRGGGCHCHPRAPVLGIRMENTQPLKERVGQGAGGQGSVQSGLVKFEACAKHPGVLWAAGFLSLQLRGDLWAGDRFLYSSIDNDGSQSEEETEGEET